MPTVANTNTKRAQYRAKATELREDQTYRQQNPLSGSVLNSMVHCKLPNDAPQCCCTFAFERIVLGTNPEAVVYHDTSKENQELRDQLKEVSVYRDMFASSQLELRKAQDERDRLNAHVKALEAQITLLSEQNDALCNNQRRNNARPEPRDEREVPRGRGGMPYTRGSYQRGRGGITHTSRPADSNQ